MPPPHAIQHKTIGFLAWAGSVRGMPRAHLHFDVEVNRVFAGSVDYLLGGHRVRIRAGELGVFWAAIPHRLIDHDPAARAGWVTLPLNWLWRWAMPGTFIADLLGGRLMVESDADPADRARIDAWAKMLRRRDRRWHEVAELEVQARFRQMLLNHWHVHPPVDGTPRRSGRSPSTPGGSLDAVHDIAAYLSDHFRQAIDVSDAADHVGLHPNYAMRLFRKRMGMTILDYLTRQRIAEAQRRLLTTDDSVLNVALDSGFGSTSRFHAAFKQATGTTPGRFRRQAADDAVARS